MKITVIATNNSEDFPLGKELTIDSFSCRSYQLGLYEAGIYSSDVFSLQEFTIQTSKVSIVSLEEIIVEGYFSSKVDGGKLSFLNLSITQS